MLYAFGDSYDGTRCHLYGRLAPFLVPATTTHTHQHLNGSVMDMPEIPTARFEGHIVGSALSQHGEVALACEVFVVWIWLTLWPYREIYSLHDGCLLSEELSHRFGTTLTYILSYPLAEHGRNLAKLLFRDSHFVGTSHMGIELWLTAWQGRSHDRCD